MRPLAWLLARPSVASWLIARAQGTPYSPIGDYMDRWWLFNPYGDNDPRLRAIPWLPLSVRVHNIKRPDDARHQHDHPWHARTFVLRGGYVEERGKHGVHVRLAGHTASLRFNEFHAITEIIGDTGAWTLFVTYRYRGTWGFKVPWREYTDAVP